MGIFNRALYNKFIVQNLVENPHKGQMKRALESLILQVPFVCMLRKKFSANLFFKHTPRYTNSDKKLLSKVTHPKYLKTFFPSQLLVQLCDRNSNLLIIL